MLAMLFLNSTKPRSLIFRIGLSKSLFALPKHRMFCGLMSPWRPKSFNGLLQDLLLIGSFGANG